MHLVLRSTHAKGAWSFRMHRNRIQHILRKFAGKYGVKILDFANVGNHLHIHIKIGNRYLYRAFIRAITSAIAMAVTGASRWRKSGVKFWDRRPFTRVVKAWCDVRNLRQYFQINRYEGEGVPREIAREVVRRQSTA